MIVLRLSAESGAVRDIQQQLIIERIVSEAELRGAAGPRMTLDIAIEHMSEKLVKKLEEEGVI